MRPYVNLARAPKGRQKLLPPRGFRRPFGAYEARWILGSSIFPGPEALWAIIGRPIGAKRVNGPAKR